MTELTVEKANISQKGELGRAAIVENSTFVGAKRLQEIRKEKGPREALAAFTTIKPIDELAGMESVDRMGIERDGSGAKRRAPGGAEYARFEQAGLQVGLIELYLKEGFDKIPDPTVQADIVDNFKRALALWPETSNLGNADLEAYIKKRLKDPKFIGRVKSAYEGSLKLTEAFDQSIIQAEDDFRKAERDASAAEKNYNANRTDYGEVTRKLDLYGRDPATNNPRQLLLDLESARIAAPAHEANKTRLQGEIDTYNSNIELDLRLLSNRSLNAADQAVVNARIAGYRRQLGIRQANLDAAFAGLAKRDNLEKDMHDLEARKKQLETEEVDLEKAKAEADYNKSKNQAIYADAKNKRATQEDKFVAELKNTFLNAALEDVEGTIQDWEKLRKDRLDELEQKIGDQAEKIVLKCDSRWTELKPGSTNPKDIKIKNDVVEKDYLNMLQNGPEAVIRDILVSQVDSAGVRIYSDLDIDNKLADENFITTVQPELVAQLLFRKMNNKKPSPTEVSIIATSKWGEGMFQAAAAKDTKVAEALNGIHSKYGKTTGEKLINLAKDPKAYGFLASLMGLALGAPFLALGASALYGGYAAVGNAVGASGGPLF